MIFPKLLRGSVEPWKWQHWPAVGPVLHWGVGRREVVFPTSWTRPLTSVSPTYLIIQKYSLICLTNTKTPFELGVCWKQGRVVNKTDVVPVFVGLKSYLNIIWTVRILRRLWDLQLQGSLPTLIVFWIYYKLSPLYLVYLWVCRLLPPNIQSKFSLVYFRHLNTTAYFHKKARFAVKTFYI